MGVRNRGPDALWEKQEQFVRMLRVVVGRLTDPLRAVFMKKNVAQVGHLHKLLAGAAKLGITEAQGLAGQHQGAMPMGIANLMLCGRPSAREETLRYIHDILATSDLEEPYLREIRNPDEEVPTSSWPCA